MFPPSRRRLFVPVLGVLAFSIACGSGRDAEREHPPASTAAPASAPATDDADPRPKIVCLGDSLTAGLGLLESQAYPSVLQQRIDAADLDFAVVNAGVSGDTTAGGLRRLEWVLQGDVKVLIVALGGNDALRGLSVADMKQNLSAIVEQAQGRGIAVVLAGMQAPPNYGREYADAFRQAFVDLARQHRITYIPFILDKVAGDPSLNQNDGIHPNPRGAEIMADTVWQALRPLLVNLSSP